MKQLILGTAGHIDHGKSSLVQALTGTDPDRLPEEKARGITIELGFAHLELPEAGVRFGIVDVPGHERFVRTMVAGVSGIDLVLLVIAADAGVMPQTREHLAICQLLGVRHGLVALSKSDLVDREWLELQVEEVREFLAGSCLEEAPIVPVSARSGAGLAQLTTTLGELAAAIEPRRADGPFRLPVDRVFSVAGFGTVVTGTLVCGSLTVGAEAELLPGGLRAKVRGLQVHGGKAEQGVAGQRLAVNLQGIDHHEVQRGEVLVPAGLYRPTLTVDVQLRHLASAPRELKHRARLRLLAGTSEVPATLALLDRDRLPPGETACAQLRLDRPLLLLPGDPFVLRCASPTLTIGGGRILDPFPPRRRRRTAEAVALLASAVAGDEAAMLCGMVAESRLSGTSLAELQARTGLSLRRLEAALAPLLAKGDLLQLLREPRLYLSREAVTSLRQHLLLELAATDAGQQLREGVNKEELKSRLPKRCDPRCFAPLLAALEKDGLVLVEREMVKLPGGSRQRSVAQNDQLEQLASLLAAAGNEPPTLKELATTCGLAEKQVTALLGQLARETRAVRVRFDLYYAPEALAALRATLHGLLQANGAVTPGELREATGLSRKYLIPLLEYFDSEKLTIRSGDRRVLRRG